MFDLSSGLCAHIFCSISKSHKLLCLSPSMPTHSHNFIYTINMKSVIALALVGSAAAFAPTTQGPVSTTFFAVYMYCNLSN